MYTYTYVYRESRSGGVGGERMTGGGGEVNTKQLNARANKMKLGIAFKKKKGGEGWRAVKRSAGVFPQLTMNIGFCFSSFFPLLFFFFVTADTHNTANARTLSPVKKKKRS